MIRQLVLIALVISLCFSVCSCTAKQDETVDYSQYSFTDIAWTRKAEHDTETIRFGSDGSFIYSCGCGNTVNDSDLNEGYTYDEKTSTVTISYIETTEETIDQIIIEECDGKSIKLNCDGEIREFVKEEN